MNYKMMGKFLSQILMMEVIFMLPALLISIFDEEETATLGFVTAIAVISLVALALYFICRNSEKRFYAREGFVCVGISWIAISVFGCLPFLLSEEIPKPIDALFEMVPEAYSIGEVSATGWEEWGFWYSCWHWHRTGNPAAGLPCTCFGQRARDLMWASWCRKCGQRPEYYI